MKPPAPLLSGQAAGSVIDKRSFAATTAVDRVVAGAADHDCRIGGAKPGDQVLLEVARSSRKRIVLALRRLWPMTAARSGTCGSAWPPVFDQRLLETVVPGITGNRRSPIARIGNSPGRVAEAMGRFPVWPFDCVA